MAKERFIPKNLGTEFVENMRNVVGVGGPRSIGKPNLYRRIDSWGRVINEIREFLKEFKYDLEVKIIKKQWKENKKI